MELVAVFDQKKNVVDKVPNEILRPILAKFDVQFLISVRAVCKRWKVVIEDICDEKTSIVIHAKTFSKFDIHSISKQFNGLVDFSQNCVILTLKVPFYGSFFHFDGDALYKSMCLTLAKLFHRVQNLVITGDLWDFLRSDHLPLLLSNWSSTLITLFMSPFHSLDKSEHPALFDRINNLTCLKRLVFCSLDELLPATIAQLEHCCLNSYPIRHVRVLPHLGVGFTSLYLADPSRHFDITQLAQLSGLARLRIVADPRGSADRHHTHEVLLSFICDHFASLQLLDIRFSNYHDFGKIIVQLAKLGQLSALLLDEVYLNMDYLARPKLPTLKSVQTFSLNRIIPHDDDDNSYIGPDFDGDLFCRALSTIMPSLVQLAVYIEYRNVRESISRNLHHFTNLRKHEIVQKLNYN